jgi:hypothetical protein
MTVTALRQVSVITSALHNQGVHRSRDPVLENGRRHRRGPVTPDVRQEENECTQTASTVGRLANSR